MQQEELDRLYDDALDKLAEGDLTEAEKALVAIQRIDDSPAVRNHLATVRIGLSLLQEALEALAVNIAPEAPPDPQAHVLASQAHYLLSDMLSAERHLRQALKDLEQVLPRSGRFETDIQILVNMIMQAAGMQGKHRQVLDICKRWQHRMEGSEYRHNAAVACFNLGRYQQAVKYWDALEELEPAPALQQVALLLEQGVIPPFELEYMLPEISVLQEMLEKLPKDAETLEAISQQGIFRVLSLSAIFDGNLDPGELQHAIDTLIVFGGEWGTDLGLDLLDSNVVDKDIKEAAAVALIEKGAYRYGEPIPAVVDGMKVIMTIKKDAKKPRQQDKATVEAFNRALALAEQGKRGEARALLESVYDKQFPPALIKLMEILFAEEDYDQALKVLDDLENIEPDDPAVYYNMSVAWLKKGAYDKAESCLGRIDRDAVIHDELKEKISRLAQLFAVFKDELTFDFEEPAEELRIRVEKKALPIDAGLARGLKNMPADWIRAGCAALGLDEKGRRRENEQRIIDFYAGTSNLESVVSTLSVEEKEVLVYLLKKGGFSTFNVLARKFGITTGDGFHWLEEPPESVLGRLWLRALVVVGAAITGGRRHRIAVIPVELRGGLEELLLPQPDMAEDGSEQLRLWEE